MTGKSSLHALHTRRQSKQHDRQQLIKQISEPGLSRSLQKTTPVENHQEIERMKAAFASVHQVLLDSEAGWWTDITIPFR